MLFLAFAVLSVLQTIPGGEGIREHFLFYPILWGWMGLALLMIGIGLFKKQWCHVLFCIGLLCVTIGGGITAGYAKEWSLTFAETRSPYLSDVERLSVRQKMVGGERVTMTAFKIEKYPDSKMPKQYTTTLLFPDGTQAHVGVNKPFRRNGFTYYQMSYDVTPDPMGEPCTRTQLLVRRDPGVPVVFAGFGCLLLAALGVALKEVWQCRS